MNKLVETKFALDFIPGKTFTGFTTGDDWNGFACPYFTFAQAQKLVSAWNEVDSQASYDEEQDAFVFETHDVPDETETYQPLEINGSKYYPVGTQSWIWIEC